jgi:hypothetical protein
VVQKHHKPSADEHSLPGWQLQCYTITHKTITGAKVIYLFGSGPDVKPDAANWFDEIEKAVHRASGDGSTLLPPTGVLANDVPGQEWEVELADGNKRTIRVYRAHGTVYYLSVEGERNLDEELTRPFLESLRLQKPIAK